MGSRRDEYDHLNETIKLYLLYTWHHLDGEEFPQFTLCIVGKFTCANTNDIVLLRRHANTRIDILQKLDVMIHIVKNRTIVEEGNKLWNVSQVHTRRKQMKL